MRIFSLCAAGVLLGHAAAPVAAALPPGQFGWLADLAGSCWQGTWPDGKTRDTQCYSTQYGRYLRGTIEIRSSAPGAPAHRGDSMFAWDAKTQRMQFHYWSSEGNSGISSGSLASNSDIVFADPPSIDAAKPERRSVWHRLSSDRYQVTVQERAGDGWRDRLAVVYDRRAAVDEHGASTDCSGAEFRRLDYLIGDWDVVETRTGAHFLYNRVEHANGGCAILEHLRTRDDVPSSALNFYSRNDKRWHVFFHSPTLHAVLEGTAGADGRHEVETRAVLPGDKQPTLVRQITSRDAGGRPRQVGFAVAAVGTTR